VAAEGSTYVDKHGTVRPSPLLSEIRSTTLVLARCLGGIQMNPGAAAKNWRHTVRPLKHGSCGFILRHVVLLQPRTVA
jgi:hypothetical protein